MILTACVKQEDQKVGPKLKQAINPPRNPEVPMLIWSDPNQIWPDADHTPAIFYVPHQDDETLGMGAAISEHSRVRPTWVILLTKGWSTEALGVVLGYNPNATMNDVRIARNNEFIAACQDLGVHRIYIANGGAGYEDSTGICFDSLVNRFKRTMLYMNNIYKVNGHPNAHKTVSGIRDGESWNNCNHHPTHWACATAIDQLRIQYPTDFSDIRLYRVYYRVEGGECGDTPDWTYRTPDDDHWRKSNACWEYHVVDPDNQRYGIGYATVSTLFDAEEQQEFIDYIY